MSQCWQISSIEGWGGSLLSGGGGLLLYGGGVLLLLWERNTGEGELLLSLGGGLVLFSDIRPLRLLGLVRVQGFHATSGRIAVFFRTFNCNLSFDRSACCTRAFAWVSCFAFYGFFEAFLLRRFSATVFFRGCLSRRFCKRFGADVFSKIFPPQVSLPIYLSKLLFPKFPCKCMTKFVHKSSLRLVWPNSFIKVVPGKSLLVWPPSFIYDQIPWCTSSRGKRLLLWPISFIKVFLEKDIIFFLTKFLHKVAPGEEITFITTFLDESSPRESEHLYDQFPS